MFTLLTVSAYAEPRIARRGATSPPLWTSSSAWAPSLGRSEPAANCAPPVSPRRTPRPSEGSCGLTPQQREIALLAAAGLTNKQIGDRLFLSPRTVGTHLYQLFPKLGVTSRAALRDALAEHPADPASR